MGAAHGLLVHSGGQIGPCIHFHMEMRGQADTGREGGREGQLIGRHDSGKTGRRRGSCCVEYVVGNLKDPDT